MTTTSLPGNYNKTLIKNTLFRFRYVLCLLLITCKVGYSQEKQGHIEIIQDDRIGRLADKHKALNERQSDTDGYRIQIFFDSGNNSKRKSNDAMQRFMDKYPAVKAYISYKEPYYRVRVGNFRSLIESEGFLKQIESDYPNAFPVKEKIYFPGTD
jgi:hypothetical protein